MPLKPSYFMDRSSPPRSARGADQRLIVVVGFLLATLLLVSTAPSANAARLVGSSSGFCAVTADRGVACWGSNGYGQLGVPGGTDATVQARPARVPGVADVRSITSSTDRVCALTTDGTIVCWGSVGLAFPTGRPATNVATAPGAIDVAMTRNHLCIEDRERSVRCASFTTQQETPGAFAPVRGATRVSGVSADGSGDSICMVRRERGALCIADQFGKADQLMLRRFEMPRGKGVRAATRTFASNCFVDRSRRVRCDGPDPLDALNAQGDGVRPEHPERFRTIPGIKDATGLSSGWGLCVIRQGGRLTCLNPNDAVAMRRPRFTGGGTAKIVRGIEDVREVVDGIGITCAIRTNGSVWCWGRGYTGHGTTFAATPVAVAGLTDATSISVGRTHTCAIRSSGSVSCWGSAGGGSYGSRYETTPTAVVGISEALAVSATDRGTCALTAAQALRCWGPIDAGGFTQLAPFTLTKVRPATGTPVELSGNCLQLDARMDCLALQYRRKNGELIRPSGRPTGQLITQPGMSQVAEVVDDGSVRCAIHVDRTVTCAGTGWLAPQDSRGSVAAGPTAMPGLRDVLQLSSGERGACAVIAQGTVTCWAGADPTFDGVNVGTDAPDAARGLRSPGHLVPGIDDAVAVEVDGPGGPCVVRAAGTVRCARAPGKPVPSGVPRPYEGYDIPGIDDATAISADIDHTCVLRRAGTVACWGDGYAGQLGDGALPAGHGPQFVPTPVAGLTAPQD